MRALVAVVFVALQALAAAALFLLSVHGPSALVYAAPAYLVIAAVLTWWASRRSWATLAIAGIALLGAAPLTFVTFEKAERIAYQRRIASTQISEVRDEPIVLAGLPIGVRVAFRVVAPERGYFAIYPAIHGIGSSEGFGLHPIRWTIDGRSSIEAGPFQPGRQHAVVADLYPETYFLEQGNVSCFRRVARPLPPTGQPAQLRIEIYESRYGSVERGGQPERTAQAYDLGSLLRNVGAALPPCKVQP